MMKLFIMGNTLIVLITFAWPHIQDTIKLIQELWAEEEEYY